MSTKDRDHILEISNVVWGAADIGKVIGRTARQVYRMIESGSLEGVVKIGGRLAGTRERLLTNFNKDTKSEPEH